MNRRLSSLAVFALGASAVAQPEADRALERFLERLGQRSLLIEHLDARLARTPGAERAALAERLTRLVAEELDGAATPAQRAALERRARALLDVIPEGDSIDLRLSLHRATYSNAEEAAERWRLRLASAEEVEEARRVFATLAPELARLGAVANRRVENLERLEESARASVDETEVAEQLVDARRQRSMAMYLSAWCLTYQAELESARTPALEALPRFGWLLNAEPGASPAIERVPEHTLAYEHVARAAIGVGTAIGAAGDAKLALQWLEMVEEVQNLPESLRAQVNSRRAVILARAARWTELNQRVQELRASDAAGRTASPRPLAPAFARLLAVLAFELPAGREGPAQGTIRRAALADLVARNEIGQVVDLASRYGTESLGDSGFITDYVRGLHAYRAAADRQRTLGEPDAPTQDADAQRGYETAVRLLDAALKQPDASTHPSARADAAMLLAVSAYLSSRNEPDALRAASRHARFASEVAQDDQRRADAEWLAVRTLRAAAEAKPGESALAGATEAADRFVRLFPSDPRVGALVLERASRAGDGAIPGAASAETLDALLAIPPSSPSYDAARRRAAAMLYDVAARAPSDEARREALRFSEVAGPILDADAQAAAAGDRARAQNAVLLARQILALLLADSVSEGGLAARAAERLDSLARAGFVEDTAVLAELRYRQLQIALLRDDAPRAEAAIGALEQMGRDSAGRFLDAADRLAYRRALMLWREAPASAARADAVVRFGVRVVQQMDASGQSASDPAVVSTQMIVSDAAATLWRERRDPEALHLARRLLRRALVAQPRSIDLLERSAALAAEAGEWREAASSWGTLRSGFDFGGTRWARANYEYVFALSRHDRDAARREIEQHFRVFPSGGDGEWGARMRALRDELTGGAG